MIKYTFAPIKLAFIILSFSSLQANATKYYVSTSGNDANNGMSPRTAWGTLNKLNSFTITKRDSIFFNRGDSFYGELKVSADSLYFGAYGVGNKPVITGFQHIAMKSAGHNIWAGTVNDSYLNMVLINNVVGHKARYPNSGYLIFTSYSGRNQIAGDLSGTPNYAGAEAVVRDAHYIIDVTKITSQSGGTLNLSPALTYVPQYGGNGYFIRNTLQVLDTLDEWVYSGTTLSVYAPAAPNVQASTIDTLVYLNHRKFITVDGLSFQGSNFSAIDINASNSITIKNCSVNNNGSFAIYGLLSNYTTIENDSIQNSLASGITLGISSSAILPCPHTNISNNYITHSGTIKGMALYYFDKALGINVYGDTSNIIGNEVDNSGYIGIMFHGKSSFVYHNYVNTFCLNTDDGGGIYTVVGGYSPDYNDGSIIRSNIVLNGIGAPLGTLDGAHGSSAAPGIYLDDHSRRIIIDSNSISNCLYAGININHSHSITVTNNLIFNSTGNGIEITHIDTPGGDFNIKHNVILITGAQYSNIKNSYGDLINTVDSNYYAGSNFNHHEVYYNLKDWANISGQDAHSTFEVNTSPGTSVPLFLHNRNLTDTTIKLSSPYKDFFDSVYNSSITLHPFTSVILFKL
ncbi:right-handed parallel beta-helix repeat-containing protein [Ginsengibacter hankyongi]|uniref:Right-handed parallel beta-helix repeat-containing protein n=1 Tax=Ginsengibacter hankyongi TaxID=2607284 RepID=A0A5J5IK45_9BACT|nr:right-handed parallel beta-helix repeat-containing protein [Ginsengibacter hankyongi]KAA9041455.1 right-handed parallel beta-helix repeat-containing protein [Ginsengibacter hankyongi]